MTGLDAVIADVSDVMRGWGFDLDVRNGREYVAQELQALTVDMRPKMRVIYTANGLDGNVRDRFSEGSLMPGVKVSREARQVLTRRQGVEVRIWGFDLADTATSASHQDATDPVINAVLAATCASIGEARETWQADDGAYEVQPRDVTFGALYVFTFHISIPIIFPALTVVRPGPVLIQGALVPLPSGGG